MKTNPRVPRIIGAACTIAALLGLAACGGPTTPPEPTRGSEPSPTATAAAPTPPATAAPAPTATAATIPTSAPQPTAPAQATALPTTAPPQAYDDTTTPLSLLTSFYNAINRREYQRAFDYWGGAAPGGQTFDQFAGGYAGTANVLLIMGIPPAREGAAGSQFATIPTLLRAIQTDGSVQSFVGCYTARRPNQGQSDPWHLADAAIDPLQSGADLLALLAQACEATGAANRVPYDDRSNPLDLLGSFYNAINRHEYQRAFDYWGAPPDGQTLVQFTQGYSNTASVFVAVIAPPSFDAGAGQLYAGIPTFVRATQTNGSVQSFVGCYVAHRTNPGIDPESAAKGWDLRSATVGPLPGGADPIMQMMRACPAGSSG